MAGLMRTGFSYTFGIVRQQAAENPAWRIITPGKRINISYATRNSIPTAARRNNNPHSFIPWRSIINGRISGDVYVEGTVIFCNTIKDFSNRTLAYARRLCIHRSCPVPSCSGNVLPVEVKIYGGLSRGKTAFLRVCQGYYRQ